MLIATNGAMQRALETASGPVLVVVLLIGLASVLAWTILITKLLVLSTARHRNVGYLDQFRSGGRPLDLFARGTEMRGSPCFSVYLAGARELCRNLLGSADRDESTPARLARAARLDRGRMRSVRLAMERAIGEMTVRLEDGMSLLATCVTIAPFLGLLGSAWGVMEAFEAVGGLGEEASLARLAPLVSAAMAPTVIGLVVAVPALFGHNLLLRSIRRMVRELDHHATELEAAFEREHVDHVTPTQSPDETEGNDDEESPVALPERPARGESAVAKPLPVTKLPGKAKTAQSMRVAKPVAPAAPSELEDPPRPSATPLFGGQGTLPLGAEEEEEEEGHPAKNTRNERRGKEDGEP